LLIKVWALLSESGEIVGITLNEPMADIWRSNRGRAEELSKKIEVDNLKGRVRQDAAWQKGDVIVGSSPISSIPQGVLESKPTDKLIVTAHEVKVTNNPHGVKVELSGADLGDILEQIGLNRIIDYWSLEVVRREVERYAGQHPDEDLQPPPVAP
jgi:hypothetical protein